jgi:hypothetical protein
MKDEESPFSCEHAKESLSYIKENGFPEVAREIRGHLDDFKDAIPRLDDPDKIEDLRQLVLGRIDEVLWGAALDSKRHSVFLMAFHHCLLSVIFSYYKKQLLFASLPTSPTRH